MVAQKATRQIMTVDEWRELERTSHDIKYEYIDGHVYAMSGGSLDHSGIAGNMVSALNSAFGDGPCTPTIRTPPRVCPHSDILCPMSRSLATSATAGVSRRCSSHASSSKC